MRRRHRQIIVFASAATLVAAMLVGGGWWLGHRTAQPGAAPQPTPSSAVSTPSGAPTPTPTATGPSGVWRLLPSAPLSGWETGAAGVWTGTELIVYQATATADVPATTAGAAYNPAIHRWRKLPAIPAPQGRYEGYNNAVWTGTEVIVRGIVNTAFNPATNRWRILAEAPAGTPYATSVMVWTGAQVLMWGGGCCDEYVAKGAAYTPATDTWQLLPASPLAGRRTAGAWTGTELVIVGGEGRTADGSGYRAFADAAAYNSTTRTWRRLPALPAPRTDATVTWTGTEVLVVGGQPAIGSALYDDGVAYNPATDRWRHVPAMPVGRTGHAAVWTGHQLIVWGGQTLRGEDWTTPPRGYGYDPATDRWTALPVSPLRGRVGHTTVWTGDRMLVWGGMPVGGGVRPYLDGAAYTPAATP